jgi:uncharacterized membrane protein
MFDKLVHGFPGHPVHPPLTDATIGAYTVAFVLAIADTTGVADKNGARGWWLALVVGLVVTGPTALAGLADWLSITRGTPLWRTATAHMISMLTATVFFVLAVLLGHHGYQRGNVTAGPFVLTVIGFGVLTLGGWLGGSIVYVHGMRVLNLVDEPALEASTPGGERKEQAEAG